MNKYLSSAVRGLIFGACVAASFAVAQNFTSAVQLSQDPRGPLPVDTSQNVYVTNNRHLNSYLGTSPQPAVSSCTGGALSTGSTDMSGSIATFTGTTCTVTFAQAFATAPACAVNTSTAANGQITVTTTTTTLVFTVGTGSSTTAKYICLGNS